MTPESENLQALTAIQLQHIDSSVKSKVTVSPQHMGAIIRRGSDIPKSSTPVSSRYIHPRSLSQTIARRVTLLPSNTKDMVTGETMGNTSRPHTPEPSQADVNTRMLSPKSVAHQRLLRRKVAEVIASTDTEGTREQTRPYHLPIVPQWSTSGSSSRA